MIKNVADLTQSDFETCPVWASSNELDESHVSPVLLDSNVIHKNTVHRSLFIHARLVLGNGMMKDGILFITVDNKFVYTVAIWLKNNEQVVISLFDQFKSVNEKNKSAIEKKLGIPFDEIFPMSYLTSFVFEDGDKLKGIIQHP